MSLAGSDPGGSSRRSGGAPRISRATHPRRDDLVVGVATRRGSVVGSSFRGVVGVFHLAILRGEGRRGFGLDDDGRVVAVVVALGDPGARLGREVSRRRREDASQASREFGADRGRDEDGQQADRRGPLPGAERAVAGMNEQVIEERGRGVESDDDVGPFEGAHPRERAAAAERLVPRPHGLDARAEQHEMADREEDGVLEDEPHVGRVERVRRRDGPPQKEDRDDEAQRDDANQQE
mmetsp:Transcript_21016/g.83793  ORF Transcript_21016/g.83793 Transcript_21016/m.83793 type:complete len:237 (+) Transcript_21016:150-860(+)